VEIYNKAATNRQHVAALLPLHNLQKFLLEVLRLELEGTNSFSAEKKVGVHVFGFPVAYFLIYSYADKVYLFDE
jgi:hypothetical protein